METKEACQKLKKLISLKMCKTRDKLASESKRKICIFDYCLETLDSSYKELITNCFIDKTYQFWWMDFYSTATFYRKRSRALVSFISLFEMIYENIPDFTY